MHALMVEKYCKIGRNFHGIDEIFEQNHLIKVVCDFSSIWISTIVKKIKLVSPLFQSICKSYSCHN
jgi:hypothetical protein